MKLLMVGDVHWCKQFSIVQGSGEKYSLRLDKLLESLKWEENKAEELKVDRVI